MTQRARYPLVMELAVNVKVGLTKDGKVLRVSWPNHEHFDVMGSPTVVKAVRPENTVALFQLLNMYLAAQSDDVQERLYTFYHKARNVVETCTRYEVVITSLSDLIQANIDLFNIDSIARWIENQPNDPARYKEIIEAYPDENEGGKQLSAVGDVVAIGHRPGTKTKTFVRREVRDLTALTLVSKLLLPVFCCYYNKFRQLFEKMTDMSLFEVISRTYIYNHPIVTRLYEYIRAFIDDTETRSALSVVVHSYMPMEDYPDYVFALTFCNRLANAPLTPPDGRRTFVPNIISTAVKDASDPASHFSAQRQTVKEDSSSQDSGDGHAKSDFESIAAHFTLSPGDQEMAAWGSEKFVERELYGTHTHQRLTVYDPDLVAAMVEQDRQHVRNQPCQKQLCAIIVQEFFTASMFQYVRKPAMDGMITVAAIWLAQNGYKELSRLQLARGYVDGTYIGSTSIIRWSDDDKAKLAKLFPSRPAPGIGRPVLANLGMTAIDDLLKAFQTCRWSDINGNSVPLPSSFRSQLVDIILKRQ